MIIDGQSYLLLIRDEGGAPEMQVSKLSNYLGCIFVINTSCLVLGPSHVYTLVHSQLLCVCLVILLLMFIILLVLILLYIKQVCGN